MRFLSGIIVAAAAVFIMPLIACGFGAFSGWVVGLVFEETIRTTMTVLGADIKNIAMWQVGATLGFIGGFFKTTITKS